MNLKFTNHRNGALTLYWFQPCRGEKRQETYMDFSVIVITSQMIIKVRSHTTQKWASQSFRDIELYSDFDLHWLIVSFVIHLEICACNACLGELNYLRKLVLYCINFVLNELNCFILTCLWTREDSALRFSSLRKTQPYTMTHDIRRGFLL